MAKLIRVARAIYCEPWVIEPEVHRVLCRILEAHIIGGDAELAARRAGVELMDEDGVEKDAPPYRMAGDVAVVPLQGVVGRHVGALERSSGVTDVDAFARAVTAAAYDQAVRAIVIDVDSPGGSIGGVQSAADAVRRATEAKPVVAYTGDRMASAAYWIASAANAIYADETAVVGSIGVYSALLDQSRAFEMAGLKTEVFASGPYKAAGVQGVPLSDAQRGMMQARVDELAGIFKADVLRGRPRVPAEAMQGQTFLGRGAVAVGLADSIATFDFAVRDAAKLADMRR